ncbi:hypothetical protein W822_00035 [Advenella kashmirensis W13003]|uniref:Filamentous haemagglutinin FhaB/tRNA nuclease CdiA-like TPS domain-containing protein n=1 Tax=Advenella kashmirensis W13003 TaxID=1424334 RepID=V8R035_9BURK|nr:hemagglutinin repeat-containing protein [Advenella kashmirensis]ETF04614.1 hypothetical protein W822_00035 [Advenella kashmirensis W13003]
MNSITKRVSGISRILVAGSLISGMPALAQIVPNAAMPETTRPQVVQTANGLPQVNIQQPNQAGVSLNNYSQFDVQRNGAILNNATDNTQTQLAGWIAGNPLLKGQSANVIVNQVQSVNPSLLRGHLEVAGQRAQVVVANPAGITCEGCGFINADRVTLGTGRAELNPASGVLENFVVRDGTVTLDGMDTSNTSYTQVLARAVQVKGKVWANKLDVTTGINAVHQQTGAVTPLAVDAASTKAPRAAIDVARLGGLYAGQINLLATEKGVGVHQAGEIGTSGALTLSASGKLANTGQIRADQSLRVDANAIDNGGQIYAKDSLSISSAAQLRSAGTLIAGQDLHLQSTGKRGGVTLESGSLTAAGVDSTGEIQSGNIHIKAQGAATVHGRALSGNGLIVSAGEIRAERADVQSNTIQMQTHTGPLALQGARVKGKSVSLVSSTGLLNDEGRIEAGSLTLSADQLSNRKGSVIQVGPVAASISVANRVENQEGLIATQSHAFSMKMGTLDNRAGRIEYSGQGAAAVAADQLMNGKGVIIAGKDAAGLTVRAGHLDNDHGLLASQNAFTLKTGTLSNAAGQIKTAAGLTLGTAGQVNNTGGKILSGQSITLAAGGVNNTDGIIRAGGAINATLTTTQNDSNRGDANGVLSNLNGLISAEKPIMIDAHTLDNNSGVVTSSNDIALHAATVSNRGGRIESLGHLTASVAGKLDNEGGALRSAKDVTMTANELNNQNTKTPAAQSGQENSAPKGIEGRNVLVNASVVNNQGGSILASDSLKINATDLIDNRAGTVSAVNSVVLVDRNRTANDRATGLRLNNEQGAITAGNTLWLNLSGLSGAGTLYGGQRFDLLLSGDYANTSTLSAAKALRLDVTGTLTNSGSLQAAESLSVAASNITNTSAARIVAPKTRVSATGMLYNEGLINGEATRIDAGRIHNAGGRIYGTELALQTGELLNNGIDRDGARVTGTIAARRTLAVGADTLDNNDGSLIYSGGWAVFGRWLAAQNKVDGNMQRFTNSASRVDIASDGAIHTQLFQNLNPGYRTGLVTISRRDRTLYQPDTFSEPPNEDKAILVRGRDFNKVVSEDDDKYPWSFWGNPLQPKFARLDGRIGRQHQLMLAIEHKKRFVYPDSSPFHAGEVIPEHYILGYAPDHPIWAILGLPAPSANIPEQHIEKCGYGGCEKVISEAFKKYLADNPSYEKLNVILRGYNWHVRKLFHGNYNIYTFNETLYRSEVLSSTPGRLNVGGNLALEGSKFVNDKSTVLVGGQLTGSVKQFTNIDDTTAVERLVRDGSKRRHELHRSSDHYSDYETYNPVIERHITLPATTYEIGTGNPVSATSVDPVLDHNGQQVGVGAAGPRAPIQVVSGPKPEVGQGELVIRTLDLHLEVPKASLFQLNPGSPDRPLIETDPAFANYEKWIGSDYMLAQLGLLDKPTIPGDEGQRPGDTVSGSQPNQNLRPGLTFVPSNPAEVSATHTLKRLGDGYYEARMVADQVGQLTGRRFLNGQDSDLGQFRTLMQSGVDFARAHKLRPGVALTAEQMQALTSDIVWLVEKSVTLPDGTTTKVLAPQVYVRVGKGDLSGTGTLVSADKVDLTLSKSLDNTGTLAAHKMLKVDADSIRNLNGARVSGTDIALKARSDIDNIGSSIKAERQLNLSAGNDIRIGSTVKHTQADRSTHRRGNTNYENTVMDRVAEVSVRGQNFDGKSTAGTLSVVAGNNISLNAAKITNSADAPESRTRIQAGNALTMGTVTTGYVSDTEFDSRNRDNRSVSTEVGTLVKTAGDIALQARDTTLRNANVQSDKGEFSAAAEHDLTIEAGRAQEHSVRDTYYKHRGFFKSVTKSSHVERHDEYTLASELSGQNVRLQAGNNIKMTASNVVGDRDVQMSAGNNLTVAPETTRHSKKEEYTTRKSGILSGGKFGVTFGSQRRSDAYDERHTLQSQSRSTIGSLEGDVSLKAEEQLALNGTDLVAAGNIALNGSKVNIDADTDHRYSKETHSFSQSGVTVSVESAVIDAVQAVSQLEIGKKASQTKSSRMKALATLNDIMSVGDAVSGLQSTAASLQSAAAGKGGSGTAGAVLSILVGGSSSKSERVVEQQTHHGSLLQAGKDIRIQASGADDSDVHIKGSNVSAGGDLQIAAGRDIVLGSTVDTESVRGRNQSSSGAVGVAIGYENGSAAFGIRLSGSIGRGKENGDAQIHNNTRLNAQREITLESGKDTTLQGATVTAPHIRANVGGDLVMESPQDTETYKSDQKSAAGSVTIGYGASGSAQVGMQKIKSDFVSVGEQTGLIAGDQGFDVKVGGHTALIGAVISSTDPAVQTGANHFSTGSLSIQDMDNHAEFHATSVSLGGGYSPGASSPFGGGAGIGNKSGSASSVSRAGISGIAGHTDVRAGDKQTGLQKIFDAEEVQKEIAAQVAITKEFGMRASKLIGDYADSRLMEAAALQRQALNTTDAVQRDRLLAQAASINETWGEGGAGRIIAHTVVGGLTGNVAGAAGAAVSQLSAPAIDKALRRTDIPKGLRDALVGLGSNIAGAAAGGATGHGGAVAGVATAHNATLNNYLKHDEVKRFANQLRECHGNQACENNVLELAMLVSQVHDKELINCKGESCNQLKADYLAGTKELNKALADDSNDPRLMERLLHAQTTGTQIVRHKGYGRVDNSPQGVESAQKLLKHIEILSSYTGAGRLTGVVTQLTEVASAIKNGELDKLADNVVKGILAAPENIRQGLLSDDPIERIDAALSLIQVNPGKHILKGRGISADELRGLEAARQKIQENRIQQAEKLAGQKPVTINALLTATNKNGAAPTATGHISKTHYENNKQYYDNLRAEDKSLIQRIQNGEDKNGRLKEQLAENLLKREGYTIYPGKYGSNNGFDVLAVGKDGSILALEVKPIRKNHTIQLGRSGKEGDVIQLDNTWISRTLNKLPQDLPYVKNAQKVHRGNSINRAIFGVEPTTGKVVLLPVKFN